MILLKILNPNDRAIVSTIHLRTYHARQLLSDVSVDEGVVVGRQDLASNDPEILGIHSSGHVTKLIVAPASRMDIPRKWFEVEPLPSGGLAVNNLHTKYPLKIVDGEEIEPRQKQEFQGPLTIDLGREITIVATLEEQAGSVEEFRSLESEPVAPGNEFAFDPSMTIRHMPKENGAATVELLKVALQVVQQAAGSDAFFQKAVAATTQIADLDRAIVLMSRDSKDSEEIEISRVFSDEWHLVAESLAPTTESHLCPPISASVLSRVDEAGSKTIIHDPVRRDEELENAPSLQGVQCVVASPILNRSGEMVGMLYGDRWMPRGASGQTRITELEATLVEVLAGAVAAGVARKSEERRRGNLSGFFSPRVADLLASSPEMLDGQDAEISVLFCDIRGFSSVTERLGPKRTIAWINDVLTELSQCVVETDGVLVDYVGDELMAMWGAPGSQPDHAERALRSAIAMLNAIEKLRLRWANDLPRRFGAGIGVNSGPARVGNVGSKLKFKYGVLGNTVNVGSRLQAATKQLHVDCIASRKTIHDAGYENESRRLALLRVVGIEEPVDVYQVTPETGDHWDKLSNEYQLALDEFEQGNSGEATRRLGELIQQYPNDRPSRQLLARAADHLNDPDGVLDPIWRLIKK